MKMSGHAIKQAADRPRGGKRRRLGLVHRRLLGFLAWLFTLVRGGQAAERSFQPARVGDTRGDAAVARAGGVLRVAGVVDDVDGGVQAGYSRTTWKTSLSLAEGMEIVLATSLAARSAASSRCLSDSSSVSSSFSIVSIALAVVASAATRLDGTVKPAAAAACCSTSASDGDGGRARATRSRFPTSRPR
jgi:hypothetical protein